MIAISASWALTPLFHWSPREVRETIRNVGLRPGSPSLSLGGRVSWICLGTSPRRAWSLSGDMDWGKEQSQWDLWQVALAEGDDLRFRNDGGLEVVEIKVHNVIPPDRLWWVGEREPWLTV